METFCHMSASGTDTGNEPLTNLPGGTDMSTDETLPTRRPKPASPDPASQAPTEARPAFEATPPPAGQPSFQPARPRFVPGSTPEAADEPGYQRSAEPQTVQAEALRPGLRQAPQAPPYR